MQSPIAAAGEIGFKAYAALRRSDGVARPLPGFRGHDYLLAGDELIWVGPRGHAMHPRAVPVDAPLPRAARALRIEIAGRRPWLPPASRAASAAALRGRCRALCDRLASIGAPRGFGTLLAGAAPGFPLDLGAAHAREVAAAHEAGDPGRVVEASLPLVGFGPGLTPSGDDFVGAALFAAGLLRAERSDVEAWQRAAQVLCAAARRRTHPVSAVLLGDLAAGRSFGPLHLLAKTLARGAGIDDAVEAARALTAIGHSSGWDMLAGFVAGLGPGLPRRASTP